MIKSDSEDAAKIVRFAFNLMFFFSEISEPFIPDTCEKIKDCIGKSRTNLSWPSSRDFSSIFFTLSAGQAFQPIDNLFSKIEENRTIELQNQFRGTDPHSS